MSEAQLNPNSELGGDEMAHTRVIRKPSSTPVGLGTEGENGEFTVKLLKVRIKGNTIYQQKNGTRSDQSTQIICELLWSD